MEASGQPAGQGPRQVALQAHPDSAEGGITGHRPCHRSCSLPATPPASALSPFCEVLQSAVAPGCVLSLVVLRRAGSLDLGICLFLAIFTRLWDCFVGLLAIALVSVSVYPSPHPRIPHSLSFHPLSLFCLLEGYGSSPVESISSVLCVS